MCLLNEFFLYFPIYRGCALLRQAVGDTWDKTPEQGPLRLMALKRIFKYYVRHAATAVVFAALSPMTCFFACAFDQTW